MRMPVLTLIMLPLFMLEACNSDREQPAGGSPGDSATRISDTNRITLPPDSPQLKQIHIAPVVMKEFPLDEVTAPGKVEANPNRISHVLAPVAGRVKSVLVVLGDQVEEGQPLLTIESPEAGAAEMNYMQTQAQLRQSKSALAKAEKDLSRIRELYEHRATALKEVLNAENELAQAQSAADQSRAAADEALLRLEMLGLHPETHTYEVVVRAPIGGKVLEIAVAPGEYRNDPNTSLMTIVDLSSVWVTSQVPESSIRLIQKGERIDIELAAYPGELFHGRVERIADTVDPQTRTVKVQTELSNRDGRLRPEMFGNIHHSHGSKSLPVVPVNAIVQSEDGATVLVEKSATEFERIRITPGESRDGVVPVLSGLNGGERVVTDGAILLSNR
jgi:cobalt-zinc-cadmium efflux system membrane fusion protein